MSQDFSVLLHTPTDGTDGDCTASLKNPRGIEPRRILPQPRGSQAHTCMSPQSSDCLTFIHNLKPSDPSIFFRTPHIYTYSCLSLIAVHLPMQNRENMEASRSGVEMVPVSVARWWRVSRTSWAMKSADKPVSKAARARDNASAPRNMAA